MIDSGSVVVVVTVLSELDSKLGMAPTSEIVLEVKLLPALNIELEIAPT